MTAFERQKRYLQWIYDLEYRLAVFLCENPEGAEPVTTMVKRDPEPILQDDPRDIVEVKDMGKQWWSVLRNGREVAGFFGMDAQRRASRFASELLNLLYPGSSDLTSPGA